MEELVSAGLVKSIGVSNFNKRQLERILVSCTIPPAVNQIEVNLHWLNTKLIEFCHSKNIFVEGYGLLGSPGFMKDQAKPLLQEGSVVEIAHKHKKTPAQVLLRHGLQRGIVVLVKSVTPERIKSNFDVFNFELTNAEMEILNSTGLNKRIFLASASTFFLFLSISLSLLVLWGTLNIHSALTANYTSSAFSHTGVRGCANTCLFYVLCFHHLGEHRYMIHRMLECVSLCIFLNVILYVHMVIVLVCCDLNRTICHVACRGKVKSLLEEANVVEIARKHGKAPAQVLLRHGLQRGIVVIVKSITPERIKANFDVFDFELTDEEMAKLDRTGVNKRLFVFEM
ncbi:aldo keto reductase family 1 member B4 [Echinococcus multilocularis]|uniref:Aldo keto reductase family 1 member B4 n=1 Tax=Echinococcus multilocularis TaxID=6211 RepID=A0A087VZT1_ECHMU|nr:aldo keto reductase family 1 member B4 [Echinococcus multilocularis]